MSSFQGGSVYLRPFEEEDISGLYEYINHPDLEGRRYIPWDFPAVVPLSRDQVAALYKKWKEAKKELHLAVVSRDSQELLGHATCSWGWDPHTPDLELAIDPKHQRKRIGSEVLHLLLRYLFENQPAHVVTAWAADWNDPARTFLQRSGFQDAGRMRRIGMRRGSFFDILIFDILRSEWEQRAERSLHAA